MNKLTLKTKLRLLGAFFISIISLIGFMGVHSNSQLQSSLNDVGLVQLPAVRTMTLIDMMHDGLKAVVFESIYYSDTKDLEKKKEITAELKQMTSNLNTYLETVEKLPLQELTKLAVKDSKSEVESYGKNAEEIVALALAGKKDLVNAKLPQFKNAFEDLERKLEVLGNLIEKDSNKSVESSTKNAESLKQLSYLILIVSLLIGIGTTILFSSKLANTLKVVAEHLSSNAEKVASAALQIASSSQELSQASTEQASSLEETAASLEEITSMISKATDNAQTTSETSSESHRKAEEGRKSVDQMLHSMDEISQSNEAILNQINESNRQMSEIVKVIQDIGSRTKVINEIVFQTKLLSFNASVEAARAGEHGKGFAVVAEEVGNLAQMSGNAAKEITDMLDASISKVEGIVKDTQQKVGILVQSGKDKVDSGVTVAKQCSDVLNDIVQNVSRVSGLSQEITQASKEQALGVSEINKAMSQLDSVTQRNTATSEEAASAAEELSGQAESMKDAVSELMTLINGQKDGLKAKSSPAVVVAKNTQSNIVDLQSEKSLLSASGE